VSNLTYAIFQQFFIKQELALLVVENGFVTESVTLPKKNCNLLDEPDYSSLNYCR
jgi:hypothetical protein